MLVAILEDNLLVSEALSELLKSSGLDVKTFGSTDSAFTDCSVSPPDVLIADWCVPGDLSTERLVTHLHGINPNMRVVFMSGVKTQELSQFLTSNKWASFVAKPTPYDSILETIKECDPHSYRYRSGDELVGSR